MSELSEVWVRHAGWIERMQVESTDGVALITAMTRCFRAICLPDGLANIERWRDGRKVYDGLGSWCSHRAELPNGTMIKIKRGRRIWSSIDMRYRVLDTALTVCADENDEMEYVFRHNGQVWTIGMEEVEI